jgi:hypothetical protein
LIEYQREPTWLTDQAWGRGYLTPLELLRIGAWKSARGLAWLSLNAEGEIESRTAEALRHLWRWRGRRMAGVDDGAVWVAWRETSRAAIGDHYEGTGLLGLSGVGYRMATAVLAILDPEVWPVMDRFAVMTVFGRQRSGEPLPADGWERADAYAVYGHHLATVGRRCWGAELTIHGLDQEAMKASQPGGQLPPGWSQATLP